MLFIIKLGRATRKLFSTYRKIADFRIQMHIIDRESTFFRVLVKGLGDQEFYSKLNEVKTKNPYLFRKLSHVCARLRFIDSLRFEIQFSGDEDNLWGPSPSNRTLQYQIDRLKTYLTLTCIDISAGNEFHLFDGWLISKLKQTPEQWPLTLSQGIEELISIEQPLEFAKALKNWLPIIKQDYLNDHGVKRNFVDFIKADIPAWLANWLSANVFLYRGEISSEEALKEFYYLDVEKKVELIANYLFEMRNKYTHTVELVEPHEDRRTRFFLPPWSNVESNSIQIRTIHKNGYQENKIIWTVGIKSNVAESDIIRLILITQIRNKLLAIKDDETFLPLLIARIKYRHIGYLFLDELEENLNALRSVKIFIFDHKINRLSRNFLFKSKNAESFIQLHSNQYPGSPNEIYPAFHRQFPNHQLKFYPELSEVNLGEYLDLIGEINERLSAASSLENWMELIRSRNMQKLNAYFECIKRDLFHRLDANTY